MEAPPEHQTPDTRVLCVDDQPDITTIMRLVIDAEPKMRCVGCLASADHLVDEVRRMGGADVVLLDATMPGADSFQAMSELALECPQTRTIIYSGYHDDAFIDRAVEAGAWGCVSKNDPPQAIMQACAQLQRAARSFLAAPAIENGLNTQL